MPFSRQTLSELQQDVLNEIAATLPTGAPLQQSVLRQWALTQAGFAHAENGHLDWLARQGVPFTATGEYLEAWAALKGVVKLKATKAKGKLQVFGTIGTVIPAGTIYKRGDGARYSVDADATIGVGSFALPQITALVEGSAGNAAHGTSFTAETAIAGANTSCSNNGPIVGGAERETTESLRNRMLQAYAAPAQGGSEADYVRWALEVPGVTRAWCKPVYGPNGASAGIVTVYAMLDEAQAANNGFPQGINGTALKEPRGTNAAGDQLVIADHIFPRRPASALVYVAAPTAKPVNVQISDLSPATTEIRADIQAAIKAMLKQKASPLGCILYESDFTDAISSVPGMERFSLMLPVSNVQSLTGELFTLGVFNS